MPGATLVRSTDVLSAYSSFPVARTASGLTYVNVQDEFVAWMRKTFPDAHRGGTTSRAVFYSLDNEPDLWDHTHARLRTGKLTYREILERTAEYAAAIKRVAPGAPAAESARGADEEHGAGDNEAR